MATFTYEAMNSSGQEVKDEIEAADSSEAIAKIRNKGYFPTKVKEKEGFGAVPNVEAGKTEGEAGELKKAVHELEEEKGDWSKGH